MSNPCLLTVMRAGEVDSVHRGALVVAQAGGPPLVRLGAVDQPMFPHSTLKPLMAAALAGSGALDAFDLTARHLALAAGSHAGTAMHVRMLQDWLDRIGLSHHDLECGAAEPASALAYRDCLRSGTAFTTLHNNNAGRHLAALTMIVAADLPRSAYCRFDHPVQELLRAPLREFGQFDFGADAGRVERCGMPAYRTSLVGLAQAAADFGAAGHRCPGSPPGAVLAAMRQHPELVVGAGGLSSRILALSGGSIVVKGGLEGVFIAIVPSQRLGIAIKIDDGAQRAADAALVSMLRELELVDNDMVERDFGRVFRLVNFRGDVMGHLQWAMLV